MIAVALVTAVVGFFAVEIVFYPRCPGCPGQTPLGTVLDIGNGTGACPAGNGTSAFDCAYTFPIKVYPSGQPPATIPSAIDLTFELLNSASSPVDSVYLITLTNQFGAWIGSWNSSTSAWAVSTSGACGAPACLSAPLETGETLLLRSLPSGGLPFSHQGDQMQAAAVGGGFSGAIDAPID